MHRRLAVLIVVVVLVLVDGIGLVLLREAWLARHGAQQTPVVSPGVSPGQRSGTVDPVTRPAPPGLVT